MPVKPFYLAIQKYGFDSIKWDVLCECENTQDLCKAEVAFILYYRAQRRCYNLSLGDDPLTINAIERKEIILKQRQAQGIRRKQSYTEEEKAVLRERLQEGRRRAVERGVYQSEEFRKKISERSSGEKNGMYGRKHSPETREKMKKVIREKLESGERKVRKGFKMPEEQKRKLSEAKKGSTWDTERKAKWGERLQREYAEGIRKPSRGRTGMKHTPETIEKMRESARNRKRRSTNLMKR